MDSVAAQIHVGLQRTTEL